MEATAKKRLLNMTYYALIATMIAFVVYFFITLSSASMASWERTALYILIALLVILVIYDIICTCLHKDKYIAGIILFIITLAIIVLSLIIMAINSANGRLLIDITERFFRIILFAYLINVFSILIFCTGEKLVVHDSNRIKK